MVLILICWDKPTFELVVC